jgi:hypothetical protein
MKHSTRHPHSGRFVRSRAPVKMIPATKPVPKARHRAVDQAMGLDCVKSSVSPAQAAALKFSGSRTY